MDKPNYSLIQPGDVPPITLEMMNKPESTQNYYDKNGLVNPMDLHEFVREQRIVYRTDPKLKLELKVLLRGGYEIWKRGIKFYDTLQVEKVVDYYNQLLLEDGEPPGVERIKPKYSVGSRVRMMGEFLGTITKVTPTHIHCISDPTKHNPVPQECIDTIEEFENLAELIQDNE